MSKFEKVRGQQINLDPKTVETNRSVWDAVSLTDPDFTKPVSFGRKFTAIDAYYNVMRATELWGPFGSGWGYDLEDETIDHGANGKTAKVKLTLWYADQAGRVCRCGPVIATNQLVSDKQHVDDEAFKKATTDALTKALSYLGFSADVFLGAFDDNRYVEERKKDVAAKTGTDKLPKVITDAIDRAKKLAAGKPDGAAKELETLFFSIYGNPKVDPPIARNEEFAKLKRPQQEYFMLQFRIAKAAIDPAEPESEAPQA